MKKVLPLFIALSFVFSFTHAQQRQNLLANPGAASGNLDGWEITQNGGDGWAVTTQGIQGIPQCFITSYGLCSKFQKVDLLALGYDAAWLDSAPIILYSDWYKSGLSGGANDTYYLKIQLLDQSENVLITYDSGNITTSDIWQQVKGSLLNYGAGVRFIVFEHGGIDGEFWAGHYGAAIDASYLSIGNNLYYSGGHTGDIAGWDVTVNGGDGWGFKDPGGYGYPMYITSYDNCFKSQTIDLLALGYTAAELDLQPLVAIHNWVLGGEFNFADEANLTVKLLDQDLNTLAEYLSGPVTCSDQWQLLSNEFTQYGPGLRYILFEHGGIDAEFWSGHYGAIFDDAEVVIDLSIINNAPAQIRPELAMQISPNPNQGSFLLALDLEIDGAVQVFITDQTGRNIFQKNYSHAAGTLRETLHLEGAAPGVYYAKVVSDGKTGVQKIVVQR